ncbi:MAG: hypothetical protein CVV02_13955 [Firmicutes bacterium HGW-Firmicutes-7]|nr:MAG: hypothetical protein CVV02_13955 [Firmicutes bacterium HGW-Firmicutes-7]
MEDMKELNESTSEKNKKPPKVKKPPKAKKPPKPKKVPAEKRQKIVSSEDQDKGSGKVFMLFIVLFVLIGAFILLVKLDVGGIGTNVLGPKLKDVPVLNLMLPKMENPDTSHDSTSYNFETIDQAVERLRATEILLKEKEKEAEKLNETINLNKIEIERLKVFESEQVQFKNDKDEFDLLVSKNVGSDDYIAYVEKAYPENALTIYESLVKVKQFNEEVAEIAIMYQEMKPKNAAAILEETISKNIDMAAQILLQLEPSQAGAILAAMDSTVADKISRYMYPENI